MKTLFLICKLHAILHYDVVHFRYVRALSLLVSWQNLVQNLGCISLTYHECVSYSRGMSSVSLVPVSHHPMPVFLPPHRVSPVPGVLLWVQDCISLHNINTSVISSLATKRENAYCHYLYKNWKPNIETNKGRRTQSWERKKCIICFRKRKESEKILSQLT